MIIKNLISSIADKKTNTIPLVCNDFPTKELQIFTNSTRIRIIELNKNRIFEFFLHSVRVKTFYRSKITLKMSS